MPVFSGSQSPVKVRAGLAFMLAVLIFPVVRTHVPQGTLEPIGLMLLMVQETLFGVLLGFIARLILIAIQFGGTVIGYQMGFAQANILDPQSQQQVPLMGQFLNVVAILVFLAVDGHHIFLQALVRSYEVLPPGGLDFSGRTMPYVMELTGDMFVLGLKLVAPVMVVLVLTMFALGIMSRLMPQLNVLMLSFPLKIGLGIFLIGVGMNVIVAILGQEFQDLTQRFLHLFQTL
ncbi:MAG: flagellar biosynthetic protein FliR [Desulfohalobiaceae bacterium]|nr:flagellar biosynthetic protein FliR [Desulfohalobiaceae bacterium]MCF8085602.1 flagellar biosynthetic protein FliR [Desulfohalobiaceae bacterium]